MVGKAVGLVGKSYFGTDSADGTRFSYFIVWIRFGQIKHFTYVTIEKIYSCYVGVPACIFGFIKKFQPKHAYFLVVNMIRRDHVFD